VVLAIVSLTGPGVAQTVRPVVGKQEEVQVVGGDNLYKLGMRYSLAIEHFCFANHMPIQLGVAVGRKLIVPLSRIMPDHPPANGLVVNLPERGVFLFRNGQMEKFYPVAIGQPGRFQTPTGSFTLNNRVKDPAWLPPKWAGKGEITVPAGPDNPLGDRWMGLSAPGVGLHSTTSPTSIGAAASHGCMRMYPDSAHDLFDQVEVGMPVRIEYEPVKVGRDDDGNLFVVVFPDVYHEVDLTKEVAKRLDEAGLSGWVTQAQIDQWVRESTGTPQKIADANVNVTVDGSPADATGGAVMGGQGIFCSGEVLRSAGFAISFNADKQMLVQRDGKEALFAVKPGPDLLPAVMLNGKAYIAAKSIKESFGYPIQWDPKTRTVALGT
jgi:L,D-transpeptidase ErfK/SrfK